MVLKIVFGGSDGLKKTKKLNENQTVFFWKHNI